MKRYYIASLLLIILLGVSPMAPMFLSSLVANAAGCRLDEGDVHVCIIRGVDYGPQLYRMALSFWLTLFSIPAAELAFLFWIVVLAIHLIRRHSRRHRATGHD